MKSDDFYCSGCQATGSRSLCHCKACHQTFAGIGLFDGHRSAKGEFGACLDPATLSGYQQREDGVWRGPEMSEQRREDLRSRALDEARAGSAVPVATLDLTGR